MWKFDVLHRDNYNNVNSLLFLVFIGFKVKTKTLWFEIFGLRFFSS